MYQALRGFTLLEILFSFALLALLFVPVLGVMSMLYTKNNINIHNMFDMYTSKGVKGVGERRVTNSDGAMCPLFEETARVSVYSSSDIGIGTSTEITTLKAIGGQLVLGLDSSDTKDSDLALFSPDEMRVLSRIDFSPGTVDVSVSGTQIFTTHSGVTADLSIVNLYPNIMLQKNCVLKSDRRDGKNAQSVQVVKGMVVVGFEKNEGPELFLVSPDCTILDSIEFGFGVHDVYAVDDMVYILGPSNPELLVYEIIDTKLIRVGELDVSGESGNARSFDYMNKGYVFGRSRGNEELVYLDETLKIFDATKIGSSVDQIISGTSTHILLTSNKEKELQIFRDGTLLRSFDLPARAHSGVCLGGKLYVGTVATSSALIVVQ